MTAVARRTSDGKVAFRCPGCDRVHAVTVAGPGSWSWNGSLETPTFLPSVLTWLDPDPEAQDEEYRKGFRCHSYVTDGKITFLDDCTHESKGRTMKLPRWWT